MNNPIFDNNLAGIYRYNPKLVETLIGVTELTNNLGLVETDLKEPNLTFNGIELHAKSGAEIEAKQIFQNVKNTPSSIHVVFGLGLGYLFKEFAENSKGLVIVYEPNLEILRTTLEIVDFSKELTQNNVKIVSNVNEFQEALICGYTYKADATFVFLTSYKQIFELIMNEVFTQVELITGGRLAEYNTLKKNVDNSIYMMLDNLVYTCDETPLYEYKDVYKGKTALIVSAGPSLDSSIETIKANRDKFCIFCVGTAAKALYKNGIIPDFLNIMEVHDCSGQIKGLDLSNTVMILEPYTHTVFHKVETKMKLSFPTDSSHANVCWSKLTGVDISKYDARGTVSYEALYSAKILGFSKIILVGQDLAYVNNQCYSKDSAYSDLGYEFNPETKKFEIKIDNYEGYADSLMPINPTWNRELLKGFTEKKVKNLNDTLYFVKGVTGEMLPSQGGYATFIENFRDFAYQNQDLELINSSMIGANIDGFKNIPLDEAIKDVEPLDIYHEFLPKPNIYNKNKILSNLDNEREILKNILYELVKSKEYIEKYEREYKRRRTVTPETHKYFKLLMNLYQNIVTQFQPNSQIYASLVFSEEIEIQYLLRNAEEFSIDTVQEVYNALIQYYQLVEPKLITTMNKISKQREVLLESINSKG